MSKPGLIAALVCGLVLVASSACNIEQPPLDYPDPTLAKLSVPGGTAAAGTRLTLESPGTLSAVSDPIASLVISAVGDAQVSIVSVAVDNGSPKPMSQRTDGRWVAAVGLLPGDNVVLARATSVDGTNHQRSWTIRYIGLAPGVRVLGPLDQALVRSNAFTVTGQAAASQGSAIQKVEVTALTAAGKAGAIFAADLSTLGTVELSTVEQFTASVTPGETAGYKVTATDNEGRATSRTVSLRYDDEAPTVVVTAPASGASVGDGLVLFKGTAADNEGVVRVQVRVGSAGSWISAAGAATWQLAVALSQGPNTITVRATDAAGNTAAKSLIVKRRRTVTLNARAPSGPGGTVSLTLSKAQLKKLLPTEKAKELVIYYLDLRPLLIEAMNAIKQPVAYGLDTSAWGAAEKNMQKILTMKPDNSDFTGTAFEKLGKYSNALGIAVPLFLAAIAEIAPTDTYLTTKEVADALFRTVLSSHPALKIDPLDDVKKLPISLHDALTDLADLATTLGPAGAHPGILYKANPSKVLLPNFEMTVVGESNLRELEGVDLSGGKSWLLAKKAGADVVTFDFLDDDKFKVKGIADEPQVDLFFTVSEHASFVAAGTTKGANPVNGFPQGDSKLWSLPLWTLERLVVDAVYYAYRDRHAPTYTQQWKYDAGTLKGASQVNWEKGWLTIQSVANIGNPPPPSYWWGMVTELAQVRLHDGGLKEGQANLRLAVTGVTVPITAAHITKRSRQLFEEQKSKLVEASVGDHQNYDTPCDIALVRNGEGMTLRFVATTDLPGAKTSHSQPGLFSDATLSKKISSKTDDGSGDTSHEKLALKSGTDLTVYAQDRDGSVWRLLLHPLAKHRLRVGIEPVKGAP